MTELRLDLGLYDAGAIAKAVELYAPHAQIERGDEESHAILRIDSPRPGRATKVARELGNYALGLTIQGRGGVAQAGSGGAR